MSIPLLEARGLTLAYQDGHNIIYAVRDVNITIKPHQFIGILGPSGSGKSSLLYLLSGIKPPSQGKVLLHGKPIGRDAHRVRHQHFGFVFQQFFLINYLDVLGNILVGALAKDRAARNKALELVEQLGLAGLEHRRPYELSYGQRQRVAIARALINDPELVFADEPTASLDHATGREVMQLLKNFQTRGAILVVSHDETVLDDADTVYRMWDGQTSLWAQRRP